MSSATTKAHVEKLLHRAANASNSDDARRYAEASLAAAEAYAIMHEAEKEAP